MKVSLLKGIKNAKRSHSHQLDKIDNLMRGIFIDTKPPVPISQFDCSFGQWLYKHEPALRFLLQNRHFDEIEQLHSFWHEAYYRIYDIYFPETRALFSTKVVRKIAKVSLSDRDRAKAYFIDLEEISKQLTHKMQIAEQRINAMPDQKFVNLPL
jgi:hypothetical protein